MKLKRFKKKLELNKKTISNLELRAAKGGYQALTPDCFISEAGDCYAVSSCDPVMMCIPCP